MNRGFKPYYLALVAVLFLAFAASSAFAGPNISYVSPTPIENETSTANNFTVNITSNETINFTDTEFTRVEWTNQSGARLNFSLVSDNVNGSIGYITINFSADGRHNFTAYVRANWSNDSATSNNNINNITINFTRDTTAPTVTIVSPTPTEGNN